MSKKQLNKEELAKIEKAKQIKLNAKIIKK